MAVELTHQPSTIAFSKNPLRFTVETDSATGVEYRVFCQLELYQGTDERGATFSNFDRRYVYDTTSEHHFDLARLVDDYLERKPSILPFPAGSNTFRNMSDYMRCTLVVGFQGRVKALPEDPPTPAPGDVVGGNFLVYRGGFSYFNWPEKKYLGQWLLADDLIPFMTWQPNNLKVARNQPQLLTLINPADPFTAKVLVTLDDSSTATKTFAFDAFDIVSIRADLPHYFSGATLEGAKYYDIQVLDNADDTPKSVVRRYYIDETPYKQENYILFRNSLAGFDIIRLFGESEFNSDYSGSNLEVYNDKLTPDYGFRRSLRNEEQAGGKISTGFISRAEQQWLRDLRLSREVYIKTGDNWLPIEITNKKYAFPQQADLNIARIEYLHRFTDEVYTPYKQVVPDDIIID